MNLAFNILQTVFIISAFTIMGYDYKYQKIPYWLLLINYISLSLLVEPVLLIGFAYIIICKLEDKPVDFLYLLVICYLIIYGNKYFAIASIILSLLFILLNKKEKLSFMIPLEISCIIMLIERMM